MTEAHKYKLMLHAALATSDFTRSTISLSQDIPARIIYAAVTGVKDGNQVVALFCIDYLIPVESAPVHDWQLDRGMGIELADLIADWILDE